MQVTDLHRGTLSMKRLLLACLCVCTPAVAMAQVDRATLTGVVRDASAAAVPMAGVTLTHLTTGVTATSSTTANGTYLIVNLQPGEYLVEAEARGFQRAAQTVLLEVAQRATLDIALQIGSVTETVRVEGVRPLLDTQSAVVGTVVTASEVANLPLAIR